MPHPKVSELKLNRFVFAIQAAKYARATWPSQYGRKAPPVGSTHIRQKIDEALASAEAKR